MIRTVQLQGTPGAIGSAHGARYAADIRRYADHRIELVMSGLWSGRSLSRSDVLDLAESCLSHHDAFASHLTEEMVALGEAAGLTAAETIVVGGFTDFVDTVRAATGGALPATVIEDDCTAVLVPAERAAGGALFGQTWDMHDTATEFVILTDLRPDSAPRALVFTTTGCLGQIGMNETGVVVGINNLTAADGQAGVTWPMVVRRALEEETAAGARDIIMRADLAGGHNYLVLDAGGRGYSVEAMPSARSEFVLGDDVIVHTNHTLFAETTAVQVERPPILQSSSEKRLARARDLLAHHDVLTPEELMAITRDEEAICQTPVHPYNIESCGGAVMDPARLDFWAVWGLPTENQYERYSLAAARS